MAIKPKRHKEEKEDPFEEMHWGEWLLFIAVFPFFIVIALLGVMLISISDKVGAYYEDE